MPWQRGHGLRPVGHHFVGSGIVLAAFLSRNRSKPASGSGLPLHGYRPIAKQESDHENTRNSYQYYNSLIHKVPPNHQFFIPNVFFAERLSTPERTRWSSRK